MSCEDPPGIALLPPGAGESTRGRQGWGAGEDEEGGCEIGTPLASSCLWG